MFQYMSFIISKGYSNFYIGIIPPNGLIIIQECFSLYLVLYTGQTKHLITCFFSVSWAMYISAQGCFQLCAWSFLVALCQFCAWSCRVVNAKDGTKPVLTSCKRAASPPYSICMLCFSQR